jgi:hypothetical protein
VIAEDLEHELDGGLVEKPIRELDARAARAVRNVAVVQEDGVLGRARAIELTVHGVVEITDLVARWDTVLVELEGRDAFGERTDAGRLQHVACGEGGGDGAEPAEELDHAE